MLIPPKSASRPMTRGKPWTCLLRRTASVLTPRASSHLYFPGRGHRSSTTSDSLKSYESNVAAINGVNVCEQFFSVSRPRTYFANDYLRKTNESTTQNG